MKGIARVYRFREKDSQSVEAPHLRGLIKDKDRPNKIISC